jgi:hypothetical protein
MKNKNTAIKKAILGYMTWGSPMNQAFLIEALGRDEIAFTYKGGETNITKVKQAMQLHGADRIQDALLKYANLVNDNQHELRKQMADSFINPEAWIKCAKDALKINVEELVAA